MGWAVYLCLVLEIKNIPMHRMSGFGGAMQQENLATVTSEVAVQLHKLAQSNGIVLGGSTRVLLGGRSYLET